MEKNISGKWSFMEEFECGTDRGFAFIEHKDDLLTGYFEYEEAIEDEEPFIIRQEFTGTILHNKIHIIGSKATGLNGQPIFDYNLDILDGVLTHEGKIVGHSYDSEDICGVFVMERVMEK